VIYREIVSRRVRKIAKSYCLASSCPSSLYNSVSTVRILIKFDIWASLENLSRKFKFCYNPTKITGTLHKDVFTLMIISRWILLRMRNVLNTNCREKSKTHILLTITFLRKSRGSEIMWEKLVETEGPQTMWQMRFTCWISKPTCAQARTHTQKYVTLIAFCTAIVVSGTYLGVTVIHTLPVLLFWGRITGNMKTLSKRSLD
jgi:hypothetical protein